jgi:hypothetical protein
MRYDGRSNGTIGIRNSGTQDVCSNDIQKLCTLCKDCAKIGHIVQKQECVGSGDKEKFLYRNHERIKKSFYIETTRLHKIAQD